MFPRAALSALLVAFVLLAGCPGQQAPAGQGPAPAAPPSDNGPEVPSLQPSCFIKAGLDRDMCIKQEALDAGDKTKCYLIMDNQTKQECIYPFALKEPELCSDLGGTLADDCYYNAANMTAAKDQCGRIADAGKKAACLGMFKQPCDDASPVGYNRSFCEAEVSKDISKCLGAGQFADACAFDYAMKFRARGACDRIVEVASRYACLGILSEDATYCGSTNVTEKSDLCRVIVARETGDVSVCAGVTLGAVGQYKYSVQGTASYVVQCYAEVGIRLGNYTVCGQLQSGLDRDNCYDAVARGALLPEACGKIYFSVTNSSSVPLVTFKHDGCYRDVAKLMGDPSACNDIAEGSTRTRYCYFPIVMDAYGEYNFTLEQCYKVADPDWKWTCISQYAKRVQDGSFCKLIPTDDTKTTATKNKCLDDARGGMKRTNYTECESFQAGIPMDSCYRDVAKNVADPSVCNYVVDDTTRNTYCYMEIITGTNQQSGEKYEITPDQCKAISDENMKWLCVSELAKRATDGALCQTIPKNATVTVSNDVYTSTTSIKDDCVRSTGG